MIIIRNKEERDIVKAFREIASTDDIARKTVRISELQKQINELEIDKSKRQEDFDKRERELRHMIGLEKKRQEFEIESAKKLSGLEVREANLKAEQQRFAEQLKFNTERFQQAETNLKDILGEIVKRLPNVNMEVKRK